MLAAAMINAGLFAAGFVCWSVSTMTAGGGSVLLVAMLALLLRGHALAPVTTVSSTISSCVRIALFRHHIDWRLVRWYVPGAMAGAALGAWLFSQVSGHLIQVCVGLFLVSTIFQLRSIQRQSDTGRHMPLPLFIPVSFLSGMTSAIVGASGLLANPFYMYYGLTKERMLATRAVNSLCIQAMKTATYLLFGSMTAELAAHGAVIGIGAAMAIWLTRPWLARIDRRRFNRLAVSFMVFAGCLVLWHQRTYLAAILGQ